MLQSDDENGFSFSFHLVNEKCDVRRAIAKLFDTCTPARLNGETVLVHWERYLQQDTRIRDILPLLEPATALQTSTQLSRSNLQPERELKNDVTRTSAASTFNAPDPSEDKPNVLLHLDFVPPDPDGLPWPCDIWQEVSIQVPMTCTVSDMERAIWEVLVRNVQQDHELLSALKDPDVDGLLTYSVGRLASAYGQPFSTLDESEHRLEALSDFFQDPTALDRAINVTVDLDIRMRPPRNPEQPPTKFSNVKNSLPRAADRIVHKRILSSTHDAWRYIFVRLGTVHSDLYAGQDRQRALLLDSMENSNNSPFCDNETSDGDDEPDNAYSKNGDIVQRPVLIGCYTKGYTKSASDLHLMNVLAWDFGDYCIGDCDNSWEDHYFAKHDNYMEEYSGVQSHNELHRRVQNFLRNQPGELEPCVPFMPLYTHNIYDPNFYGLGGVTTSTDVVVRFVNNFDDAARRLGVNKELRLPWSVQYQFAKEETSASITFHLNKELRDNRCLESKNGATSLMQEGDKLSSDHLFNKPLGGAWKLQLWVLPQSSHVKKLFKFPTKRLGSAYRLDQFLAADKVESGDCRLYMEAHIVPIC